MKTTWEGVAVAEVALLGEEVCFSTRVDSAEGSMLYVEFDTGMCHRTDVRVRIGAPRGSWRSFVSELGLELDRYDEEGGGS